MEEIKTAVAVFCTACICAELVGRLLGDVRGRQCIKAAAGLYILAALFQALPGLREGAADFALPQTEPQDYGTAQQAILRQAERELADALAVQIADEAGLDVSLAVTLESGADGVYAARVEAALAPGWTASGRAAAEALLCHAREIPPEAIAWREEEGGG